MKRSLLYAVVLPALIVLLVPAWSQARRGGQDDDGHERDSEHSSWGVPDSEEHRPNPIPADAVSLDEGGKVYAKFCAGCHGKTGRGDGPAGAKLTPRPANLAHEAWHERPGELAWKIANGRPPMPAWKKVLNETQIWHVVNYIQSIGDRTERHR